MDTNANADHAYRAGQERLGRQKTTVEILSSDEVRERLAIVPDWIQHVLEEARARGCRVEYESLFTPFGRYPMAVRVAHAPRPS